MSTATLTPKSAAELAAARAAARRTRAEWLYLVATGAATPQQVVAAAATGPGAPLRHIKLVELLATQPRFSPAHARVAVASLLAATGSIAHPERARVAVLLDRRRAGNLLTVEWAALAGRIESPAPGWPYQPEPST